MDFWDSSVLDLVNDYDNLIVMRTASKAIGAAAIRLGFAVANRVNSNALKAVKSPYNVNTVSQKIGAIIYNNKEFLQNRRGAIVSLRENLYNGLKKIENAYSQRLQIVSGCSNFVFVKTDYSKDIFDFLLSRGVAVRLMNNYLRITAGTEDENKVVLELLNEFLAERD